MYNGRLLRNCNSHRMEIYPTRAALMNPGRKIAICEPVSGSWNNLMIPIIPAANVSGMDIKKEKRAADGLSKPLSMPPVIVAPDREMPGKIAKI